MNRPDLDDMAGFRSELEAHGLVLPSDIPGVWGRGPVFEDIVRRFDARIERLAAEEGAQALTFPPVIEQALIERLGYLDNFPHLAGAVRSFAGSESQAQALSQRVHDGLPWDDLLGTTGLMMVPAACYPVYPVFSGLLPEGGRTVTTLNWVFRREPSDEPTRLQSFRMREIVRAGDPETVMAWRDGWLVRALDLLAALGLPVQSDVASDPFFGRAGRMMAGSQREQRLKFEVLVPVISRERPTAICSFNWHREHFSGTFGIRTAGPDGPQAPLAHTACLGFGLERVTLALLRHHGPRVDDWPASVRRLLWE